MTSSNIKTSISYIAVAFLASFLTTLLMNVDYFAHENHCKLCESRSRRDERKVLFYEEARKNWTAKGNIEKVFLKKAVKNGAVCLDGSPPGYHFRIGFGDGTKKWILFFNGGAWCYDEQACYQRTTKWYGSSRFKTTFWESGLYSWDSHINPVFHNWNKVFIIYCDGSSFTGMREKPVYFKDKPVYFRGKAVLDAIIEDLLDRGVGTASDVLLTGSSAGSLAVLIHADYIKYQLNPMTKVRVVSDSGYFIDMETHYGARKARDSFRQMLTTHNSTAGLHQGCRRRIPVAQHWKCFFPQYFFKFIETPVFVLQSAYDVWQIANNFDIVCTVPSYEDMLVFKSLNVLRASRKTRRDPTHVITSWRNSHAAKTFENAHVFASPSTPVRYSSFEKNILSTQSSLNNAFVAPERHTFNPPATSQDQSNLENAFWFSQPASILGVPHVPPPSANLAQSYRAIPAARASYNSISDPPRAKLTQSYRATLANTHFMQKRELRNAEANVNETKLPSIWHWQSLYQSPPPCTRDETEKILVMRSLTLDALRPVLTKPGSGLFLSSCFEHTQANQYMIWKNGKIKGKSPRDAIAEWYFEKPGNHIHIGQEFSFETCVT